MTGKQGLELFQELLAAAGAEGTRQPSQPAEAVSLPAGLAEFARQMAQRHRVDPATGERLADPGSDTVHG